MDKEGTILVVDDEERNRILLEDVLSDEGYTVLLAENGKECLRLAQEQKPEIILLDIRMPEINGYAVLQSLKKDLDLRRIPVIMISAIDEQKSVAHCLEAGADDYLPKPFNPILLKARIHGSLEKYHLAQAQQDFFKKSFHSYVDVLMSILEVMNPPAFDRTERIKTLVGKIAGELKKTNIWELSLAAMLSQIGCITVSPKIIEKLLNSKILSKEEKNIYKNHPQKGHGFISKAPGLSKIAKIILYQDQNYCGNEGRGPVADAIPFGSRLLHVAGDYDYFLHSLTDANAEDALFAICQRKDYYDPQIVQALVAVVGPADQPIYISDLKVGMILVEDFYGDQLLVARKGQILSDDLVERIKKFALASSTETIKIINKKGR